MDSDIAKSMYSLIEYSETYLKKYGSLVQYCKDIPAVDKNDDIVNFKRTNAFDSFNIKAKISG